MPPTTYRLGDRGPAIAEIRDRLALLGLLAGASTLSYDDAEFDEAVDRAVRQFQQARGTTVDGIVGAQTWRLLDEARWRLGDRVLSYAVTHPMIGDDVAVLQRRLGEMGFDCGRVDGVFGRRTEQALKEFQRNVGIGADGTCGPDTFKALDRLVRTVRGGAAHAFRESEAMRRSGPTLAGKVVVIDPGHGGVDRGIQAHGLDEAEIAEDLAARIEGRLGVQGVTAYLSRGRLAADEEPPDEVTRAAFANDAQADLLLSLHVDGQKTPTANGVATYYFGSRATGWHSVIGERLAELVLHEVVARTDLRDCRPHDRTWDLLRLSRMPAVRLELGYLSHPGDAARLADPAFRDTVAEAVVSAVQTLFLPEGALASDVADLREPSLMPAQ